MSLRRQSMTRQKIARLGVDSTEVGNDRRGSPDDHSVQTVTGWVPPWSDDPQIFAAWGQWAGGIGSLLAVIVALWLAAVESRRRRREFEDRQAAQARTITATVELASGHGLPMRFLAVVVQNHGQLPITSVAILDVEAWSERLLLKKWELRRVGQPDHGNQSPYKLASVIGPGEGCPSYPLVFADQDDGAKIDLARTRVDISFVDAEGLRWKRENNGLPRRVLTRSDRKTIWRRARKRFLLIGGCAVPFYAAYSWLSQLLPEWLWVVGLYGATVVLGYLLVRHWVLIPSLRDDGDETDQ